MTRLGRLLLLVGVVGAATLGACGQSDGSLPSLVAQLADQAGTDVVASLVVEHEQGRPLGVRVAFLKPDGSAVGFYRSPSHQSVQTTSDPVPAPLRDGVPVARLDLVGLEQRMAALPHCEDERGQLFMLDGHVLETVRCKVDGEPTSRLDGTPVERTPAGDLPAAARQVRDDAALVGAEQVTDVTIALRSDEVSTRFRVSSPPRPRTEGTDCSLAVTRAQGALAIGCDSVPTDGFPVAALAPEAIEKIWVAEGRPQSGWTLSLVNPKDPCWHAKQGNQTRRYTLTGELSGP